MKKRIPALSVLLALLLTVSAAAVGGTGNFVRTKQYGGEFSDLSPASVFYGNVTALYEYGLSVGKGDGTFGLADSVTVNQAVIFAGRIRSLYDYGDPEAGAAAFRGPGQAAYEPYDRYLRSLGVIGSELGFKMIFCCCLICVFMFIVFGENSTEVLYPSNQL